MKPTPFRNYFLNGERKAPGAGSEKPRQLFAQVSEKEPCSTDVGRDFAAWLFAGLRRYFCFCCALSMTSLPTGVNLTAAIEIGSGIRPCSCTMPSIKPRFFNSMRVCKDALILVLRTPCGELAVRVAISCKMLNSVCAVKTLTSEINERLIRYLHDTTPARAEIWPPMRRGYT